MASWPPISKILSTSGSKWAAADVQDALQGCARGPDGVAVGAEVDRGAQQHGLGGGGAHVQTQDAEVAVPAPIEGQWNIGPRPDRRTRKSMSFSPGLKSPEAADPKTNTRSTRYRRQSSPSAPILSLTSCITVSLLWFAKRMQRCRRRVEAYSPWRQGTSRSHRGFRDQSLWRATRSWIATTISGSPSFHRRMRMRTRWLRPSWCAVYTELMAQLGC